MSVSRNQPKSSKRIYERSPHKVLYTIKTPSKSPAPKKVKRSLVSCYLTESKNQDPLNTPEDKVEAVKYSSTQPADNGANLDVDDLKPSLLGVSECVDSPQVDSDELEEITELLPIVLGNLSRDGFDKMLLDFFKLVASGDFPMQNIAFLLWTEIVKWYKCKTTEMRYSEATKTFWKLRYKLFGGRFICFMSMEYRS